MPPSVIDLEKVCRLCFREDNGLSKMTSIYEQQDLEETIKKCLQIEVNVQYLNCYNLMTYYNFYSYLIFLGVDWQ